MFKRARSRPVVGFAIVVSVLLAASPAGAAWSLPTFGMWLDGYYGGARQCALWGHRLDYDTTVANRVYADASTHALTGATCGSNFSLPQDWLGSRTVIQKWTGSAWVTTRDSGMQGQTYEAWIAGTWAYTTTFPTGIFRVVSGHQAILLGASHSTIYVTQGPNIP